MRSAMLRNADAQAAVGKFYLYGRGVAKMTRKHLNGLRNLQIMVHWKVIIG